MQQEGLAGLSFLRADDKTEESPWELASVRASHAETVLELQKTRQLLLLEHHISQDLQVRKQYQWRPERNIEISVFQNQHIYQYR